MIISYKYRAYPTGEVEAKAIASINAARYVYNHALEMLSIAPKDNKPSYRDLQDELPLLKKEQPFLKEPYSHMLQITIRQLFSNTHALHGTKMTGRRVGRLRFKNQYRFKSIRYNTQGYSIDSKNGTVTLAKIGTIPFEMHREVPDHISGVILKHSDDKWYVVFQCEVVKIPLNVSEDYAVGLDVGVKKFVVDSDGREIDNPKFLAQKMGRLKFLQKSLSRKVKGSKSRDDARKLLSRLHEKVSNIRSDRNHQISRQYVDYYDIIIVEKLNIADMMSKQHRIKKMSPSARRSLRRNIHDAAWGDFSRKIEYKAEGAGKLFIRVDSKNTTQKCSHCEELVLKDITVRTHTCPYCGFEMDRDQNAAMNILQNGLTIFRAGNRPQPAEENTYTIHKDGKYPPVKQEALTL
jgi:putative transposase